MIPTMLSFLVEVCHSDLNILEEFDHRHREYHKAINFEVTTKSWIVVQTDKKAIVTEVVGLKVVGIRAIRFREVGLTGPNLITVVVIVLNFIAYISGIH